MIGAQIRESVSPLRAEIAGSPRYAEVRSDVVPVAGKRTAAAHFEGHAAARTETREPVAPETRVIPRVGSEGQSEERALHPLGVPDRFEGTARRGIEAVWIEAQVVRNI